MLKNPQNLVGIKVGTVALVVCGVVAAVLFVVGPETIVYKVGYWLALIAMLVGIGGIAYHFVASVDESDKGKN